MGEGGRGSSGGGIREFGSLGGGFCPGDPMPELGAGAAGSPLVGAGPGTKSFGVGWAAGAAFVAGVLVAPVLVSPESRAEAVGALEASLALGAGVAAGEVAVGAGTGFS